jgi:hypothetical protein
MMNATTNIAEIEKAIKYCRLLLASIHCEQSSVNGAKTFSLFHFCKWKSGKVKKLTLFIPQNACKNTVFSPFLLLKIQQKQLLG